MNGARIAFRNLSRQKRRSFLLGGAIAFGVLIITLVNSATGGFVENVQENFVHILAGHIFLEGLERTPSGRTVSVIRDDTALTQAVLATAGIPVRSLARRSQLTGNLIFEGEGVQQIVVGVNWAEEKELARRLRLRAGSIEDFLASPDGLILNEKIARRLRAEPGDRLLVQLRTLTGQQNVGDFALAAVSADTGILSTISAYSHRSHVNALLNILPHEYTSLGITVERLPSVDAAAARLYAALQSQVQLFPRLARSGNSDDIRRVQKQIRDDRWEGTKFQLTTINDYLGSVNQLAATLNILGIALVLILFVIITVGILNTFRMVIYERTREIGTLRALGMQRRSLRGLFLLESLFLSLGGALAGLAASAAVAGAMTLIRFDPASPFAVFLSSGRLTFKLAPANLLAYLLGVAAISLLAVLVPAVRAANLEPARSLRQTY